MTASNLRIALFADSFLEVDGAAMTCRRLVNYAKTYELPMTCFHAGPETKTESDGSVTYFSMRRSPVAIAMDKHLAYDPLFQRHASRVLKELEKFRPDVIHITGLNDVSIIGAYLGWKLQIPILGSWHTNLHEFAAQRLRTLIGPLNRNLAGNLADWAEKRILAGSLFYYKMPKVVLAPNVELVDQLAVGTGRSAHLMSRGVDSVRFSPEYRTVNDGVIRFGFVGRLQPEKNVRVLAGIERSLIAAGHNNFRFTVVGEGSERAYLAQEMQNADFTGFLDGDALSAAYANMDVFLFPSETDAFGNVVQEAQASGVPAIVSDKGGPKFIVEEGVSGFVARDLQEFIARSIELISDAEKLDGMKAAARRKAESRSWDAVFESVYDAYEECYSLRNRGGGGQEDLSIGQNDSSDGLTLRNVVIDLVRHPLSNVLLCWNWKSALLSALLRSPIFFTIYFAQNQGLRVAAGAMAVQFVFRTFFGGLNGAILQAFSKVKPAWHAVITIPFVLAAVSHLFEYGLQAAYDSFAGSKGKSGAVLVSISISVVSAFFNLFAMRRGVLLVRDESEQSLWRDLRQMPFIAFEFISFPLAWTWRKAKKA